ncbi:hypothetical protein CK203_097855 [Vitis vinifera]|uniref:Aspartic peptidase DDI1-type domain-containing protein n=1 Tax=Vitis vinifera TaxID=29760 RepID=A0A438CKG3_VITVI|nr:hypothetical protein CK203_097855 [Vitis vinifera]
MLLAPPFPMALQSKKVRMHLKKKAFLTEQVSAIIQCKTPIKYKDPGCPTISVNIGNTFVKRALLDLGAIDFVVLDTEQGTSGLNHVPIILGQPFLATANALINCRSGVMQLTFGNMTIELNIFHSCKKHGTKEEEELKEAYLIELPMKS